MLAIIVKALAILMLLQALYLFIRRNFEYGVLFLLITQRSSFFRKSKAGAVFQWLLSASAAFPLFLALRPAEKQTAVLVQFSPINE